MGFRWFNTSAARAILLMGGTAILTWGIAHMQFVLIAIGLAVLVYTMFTYKRGVKSLKEKCFLMLEAIRNNDYSFRLPTVYHSDNEQVLQDTINEFGNLMNEQKQQMVRIPDLITVLLRGSDPQEVPVLRVIFYFNDLIDLGIRCLIDRKSFRLYHQRFLL